MEAKKAAEKLQGMYKRYKMSAFAMIGILILAAAGIFWNRYAGLAVLLFAVLYQLLYLRRLQKNYTKQCTVSNLACTLEKKLNAAPAEEKGGADIDIAMVEKAELLPVDSGAEKACFYWGLRGKLGNAPVSLSDATFAESYQLTAKGKKRTFVNCGCWMHFTLPKDSGMDLRIWDQDVIPMPMRKAFLKQHPALQLLPPEQTPFLEEGMYVYTAGDNAVGPNDDFYRLLKKLRGYTPGKLAVSIRGASADVFIRNRFLSRPVSMSEAADEGWLSLDPMPELSYVQEMLLTLSRG